jgi:hypothetical protein
MQQDPAESSLKVTVQALICGSVGLFVISWIVNSVSPNRLPPTPSYSYQDASNVSRTYSVAEKVAAIDNGRNSTVGSSQIERSLVSLALRFGESHEDLAARSLTAQKLLQANGVNRSLGDILSDIESASCNGTAGATFAETLAAYVTIAGR